MDIAFAVSKIIVTEYTLLRQWWPEQLRQARYVDTGMTRTYFLDRLPSPGLYELMDRLNAEGKTYRFMDLRGVDSEDASHNL